MQNLDNGSAGNNTMDRALLLVRTIEFINRQKNERLMIEAVYGFAMQLNNLPEVIKAILKEERFEMRKQMLNVLTDLLAQHIMSTENPDLAIQQLREKVNYQEAA